MSSASTIATDRARLTWRGVVEVVGGKPSVALEGPRCKGGCGIALFAPRRIFLNTDLGASNGMPVEVSATARHLAWRALLVFGTPLAVVLAAVLLVETVETIAWPSWLIVVALLGTVALMLGVQYAWRRPERALVVERDAEGVRIRID